MTSPLGERPQLRPLSVGELLDVAIKICLAHWRTLVKTVLVVVVPVQIVSTLLTADYTVSSFDFGSSSSQTTREMLDELNQYIGGIVLSSMLQILALLLATAACFRAIALAYLGESTDWRSSLSYALRHAPSLLLLALLYVLGVVAGAFLFLLPGIWLYIAWAFAMPVLLVEGLRGRQALARSYGLVRGRWWRTFGVIVLGFILALIISTLVQGIFLLGLLVDADSDALVLVLAGLAGIVGLAISTPFQAALLTVVYFDLRVRKEGFDIELLASGIGAAVPAGDPLVPAPSGNAASPASTPFGEPAGGPYWPASAPSDAPPAPEPDERAPERGDEPSRPPPPPGWGWPDPGDRGDDDEPPRLPGVPSG
ncbi:MAG: glycerophosphoryl diester phosphodiesterase membrane domain-containing protein [Solirubrobacteraceae bacterium]|nr:glycerophosphoryl diester phosphodiesterase membrane domain-containing protein [Solirubrobacteraceae bacterium]